MPYKTTTVRATKFMAYKKVNIYHTYRNDDIEDVIRQYWFVTDPYGTEDDAFDVRDYPFWEKITRDDQVDEESHIKEIIRTAIDLGYITKDGIANKYN
jgi:hypothetical protein